MSRNSSTRAKSGVILYTLRWNLFNTVGHSFAKFVRISINLSPVGIMAGVKDCARCNNVGYDAKQRIACIQREGDLRVASMT